MIHLLEYLNLIQSKSENTIRYKAGWYSLYMVSKARKLILFMSSIFLCILISTLSAFGLLFLGFFNETVALTSTQYYFLISILFVSLSVSCVFLYKLVSESTWIERFKEEEVMVDALKKTGKHELKIS